MMPPADRIYDPGQAAKKDLTDTGDDFLAIGFFFQHTIIISARPESLEIVCVQNIYVYSPTSTKRLIKLT